jgi:uncharacterized protein (DUF2235 family)
MGYRSDVKYVLLFESNEDYSKFLGEATLMCGDDPQASEIMRLITEGKKEIAEEPYQIQVRVHWEDVKWYDTSDWVEIQDELMDMTENYNGAYFFVRVGEEEGDVETRGGDPKHHYHLSNFVYVRTTSYFE